MTPRPRAIPDDECSASDGCFRGRERDHPGRRGRDSRRCIVRIAEGRLEVGDVAVAVRDTALAHDSTGPGRPDLRQRHLLVRHRRRPHSRDRHRAQPRQAAWVPRAHAGAAIDHPCAVTYTRRGASLRSHPARIGLGLDLRPGLCAAHPRSTPITIILSTITALPHTSINRSARHHDEDDDEAVHLESCDPGQHAVVAHDGLRSGAARRCDRWTVREPEPY